MPIGSAIQRGVRGSHSLHKDRIELPAMRELDRTVQLDGPVRGSLRDHINLIAIREDARVGELIVALEDGLGRRPYVTLSMLHAGDHSLASIVIGIFEK